MNRKDALKAALGGTRSQELPADNTSESFDERRSHSSPIPEHVRSGAVGAMSRSLGNLIRDAETARASVTSGQSVIELKAEQLETSFVEDRIGHEGSDYRLLVESIRQHGQQVPILARPHPQKPRQFQIAYGHRRVRALLELQRPVRAVVRPLSDEELVVAQGQENSLRSDLSYIERARFAVTLEDKGFPRSIIMSALNMEKTQLSKLITLGRSIPSDVSAAIGAAPKAGRPRWMALAERLNADSSRAMTRDLFTDPAFMALGTDARFQRLFDALSPRKDIAKPESIVVKNDEGRKVAVVERSGTRLAVVVDEAEAPNFGDYLAHELLRLYRAFRTQEQGGNLDHLTKIAR